MEVDINEEKLNRVRFADDIIADRIDEGKEMLERLQNASGNVVLNMYTNKTEFLINLVMNKDLRLNIGTMSQAGSYKYLGHEIRMRWGKSDLWDKT